MRARRIADGHRPVRERGIEDAARLHLVPVVVLGVDPEDRDRRHVVPRPHAFGELDRRDGLQQREQRSAEESRLLAGDDRDGLRMAKLSGRRHRFRRRAASALLGQHDVGDRVARARVLLAPGNRVAPRAVVAGVAGKEIGDLRVVEGVIDDERPDPREPADVDGDA